MYPPEKFKASEPKKPTVYHKAGKCRIHKTTKLVKDDHECCGCCCSGCEPDYTCPKCEALYDKKHQIWFNKWGHIVAVDEFMVVENGKIKFPSPNVRLHQFYHGGTPVKIGKFAKIDPKTGFVKLSRKKTDMFIIG